MTKEELLELMTPGGLYEAHLREIYFFSEVMGVSPKEVLGEPRFEHFRGCVQCRFLGHYQCRGETRGARDLWYCNSEGKPQIYYRWASGMAGCDSGWCYSPPNEFLKEAVLRTVERGLIPSDALVVDYEGSNITIKTWLNNMGLTIRPERWSQSLQPQKGAPA